MYSVKADIKEKAREIAKHIIETYDVINKDNLPNALWMAAINMAEWKDEQFKESVNKAMKRLEINLELTEAELTHIRKLFNF